MLLQTYLTFAGNCKEAINFYKDCLNGEIVSMQYFKDQQGMPVKDEVKDNVLHSVIKFGDNIIMASDNMDNSPVVNGGNITLCHLILIRLLNWIRPLTT